MEKLKKFNVTGICVPHLHHMVTPDLKIRQIMQLIDDGEYFTINRPRQYGKTTTLFFLFEALNKREDTLPLELSLEGVDDGQYQSVETFLAILLLQLEESLRFQGEPKVDRLFESTASITSFPQFGQWVGKLITETKRKIVLLIDEVDQAGNQPIFLQFLGFLRARYLSQKAGRVQTFHSVVLAGVHDVKNLKAKIRSDQDQQYNSPWNIAANFEVDMKFSVQEIASMLQNYMKEKRFDGKTVSMNIEAIADRLHFYTSGYPFLVSLLCKTIDETLQISPEWHSEQVREAVKIVLKQTYTNFESLIKNLENNPDLYEMVFDLLVNGNPLKFNSDNPIIDRGVLYGILRNEQGQVKVHNRIYAERIFNYLTSKLEVMPFIRKELPLADPFVGPDGNLDLKAILLKFQTFMKEQYSKQDATFLEWEGRLIFLAFLQPILNGKGFTFKETQISEERRLDVVITFRNQKFVVELKRWRGEKAHEKGIKQLTSYLDSQNLNQGYLLIFDFNKRERTPKQKTLIAEQKELFLIWV